MALSKQSLSLPFGIGVDTKTDPLQITPGTMLSLTNAVFTTGKRLTKRNGFAALPSLPSESEATTLTTFDNNLTAIGNAFYAYSSSDAQWLDRGRIQPVQLSVQALVRTPYSNAAADATTTASGLGCTVFLDGDGIYKYQITNTLTGQVEVGITQLPSTASQARVFLLGNYFIITFLVVISSTPHLQYIAISTTSLVPGAATDLTTQVSSGTAAYDGYVANNSLYVAWNASDGGGAIRFRYLTSTLIQSSVETISGQTANLLSVTVDQQWALGAGVILWITWYTTSGTTIHTAAYNQVLSQVLAPTLVMTETCNEITSIANLGILTVLAEVVNDYPSTSIRSDYIEINTVTQAGTVGTPSVMVRSVGLASKPFLYNSTYYVLVAYGGTYQPSYFLSDTSGNIVAKLAYSNGGGYETTQVLPSVSMYGSVVQIAYLYADQITAVNKTQGSANPDGIYTQTGVNLASFDLAFKELSTAEIGGSLHVASGFLWQYDGVKPVEHGFHLWPEDIQISLFNTGGNQTNQVYYYQVTYEWTDGAGMLHRSAPSVPVKADHSGGSTSTNETVLQIPTLRLTYKTAPNGVRIVIYRWSTGQQNYYQVTSVTSPLLNDPTVDTVSYTDTQADSSVLGNELIYTTGGVLENIAAPACSDVTLFDTRLWLIDAEDRNLLWFSKQVIESTPVETSDFLTQYVPPTTGASGSTGIMQVIFPMDDKIVIAKKDALAYINGSGPDNTGANNNYSQPTFITSTVGSALPASFAFTDLGLMFESDKGIWLLGRGLDTAFIGAPVTAYTNTANVTSAETIPGTNEVRFALDSGTTLMYDYFYKQWGEFQGISSISSCLYNSLHTYLNSSGQVFQETPDTYQDGSNPVLIGFTSGWYNLAGVDGFERAYFIYLLGQFVSNHQLSVSIAYDYNPSPTQQVLITPSQNNTPAWGGYPAWGQGEWGGDALERWRIFLSRQKCQAFQITVQEVSTGGGTEGGGLTLSNMNLVVGLKKSYFPSTNATSVG